MSLNIQRLRPLTEALEKKEATADLTDEQIEIRLHNLDSVISHLDEKDAKLMKALKKKKEEVLDLRLSRDIEKILEGYSREKDEYLRPKFQRSTKWKLRPRSVP